MLALTLSESRSYLDQLVMVTSPFTRHSIVPGPGPKFQVPTESRAAGGLNRAASKAARELRGQKKIIKIFVVQILYRLVCPAHSALHEGNSRRILLGSNSYFFNLTEIQPE